MEKNKVAIVCPICNRSHDTETSTIIDAHESEEIREKIIKGTFFDFDCPECGHHSQLHYSCMYRDEDIREYIYLSADQDLEKAAENAQKILGKSISDGLLRIVHTAQELKEKILIFEHGWDDRMIEICKGISLSQFPSDDKFYVEEISYDCIGEQEVLRLKCSDGTEQYVLDFHSIYDQMFSQYGEQLPPLRSGMFTCVDLDFAAAFLRGVQEGELS